MRFQTFDGSKSPKRDSQDEDEHISNLLFEASFFESLPTTLYFGKKQISFYDYDNSMGRWNRWQANYPTGNESFFCGFGWRWNYWRRKFIT
jgi:hypothetical protein